MFSVELLRVEATQDLPEIFKE